MQSLAATEQIPSLHCSQAGAVAQPGQQEAGPVPGHSPGYHTRHLPLLCSWPDTCQHHSHYNEGKKAEESRARESTTCYRRLGWPKGQRHGINNFPRYLPYSLDTLNGSWSQKTIWYALPVHLLITPIDTHSVTCHHRQNAPMTSSCSQCGTVCSTNSLVHVYPFMPKSLQS